MTHASLCFHFFPVLLFAVAHSHFLGLLPKVVQPTIYLILFLEVVALRKGSEGTWLRNPGLVPLSQLDIIALFWKQMAHLQTK